MVEKEKTVNKEEGQIVSELSKSTFAYLGSLYTRLPIMWRILFPLILLFALIPSLTRIILIGLAGVAFCLFIKHAPKDIADKIKPW